VKVLGLLPRRSDYAGLRSGWRADVVAGLTVGVVALPLALGFGVTSGLGAAAGLVTAIVAGLVAAVFGGSNVQVSGPTGAMTVVLVPLVARHGASAVATVGIMAGVFVVIAGITGLGQLLAYLPWPLVEGFTLGIAAIIFLQQVPAALGIPKPQGENVAAVAVRAVGRSSHANLMSAVLVVLVVATMLVLRRVSKTAPASLVAVVAATLVAAALGADVPLIGSLPHRLPAPAMPSLVNAPSLVSAALAIATLAALESLLSARVADGMSDTSDHEPSRELFGQGLASIASALFGGMPATGAIARTAVNTRAGARTRLASIVHALLLLGVVLVGGSLVARIPLAALAGVLMVTAVRMVDRHSIHAIARTTRSDAAVLVLTAGATVALNLVSAVGIGLGLAAVLALSQIVRTTATSFERGGHDIEVGADEEHRLFDEHILTYRLDGPLFFGAAQRFLTELTSIADVRVVVLRLKDMQLLDATGANALGDIVLWLEQRGTTVLIKGLSGERKRILAAVGALRHLSDERHIFDDFDQAIAHARSHAGRASALIPSASASAAH
jgi:SulP family sulfate permease